MHSLSMKRLWLLYVLLPAAVLAAVTVLRARLELSDPDGGLTKIVGVNIPTALIMLTWPWLLLRRGLSLVTFVAIMAALLALIRLPIAVVYALAWDGKWTVEGTTAPVRYVAQTREGATTVTAFAGPFFVPLLAGVVIAGLLWCATWALMFRGERRLASRSAPDA